MRFFYLIVIGFLLLVSCKREKAVWSSNFDLPLLDDSLTLANLLPDSILVMNAGQYEIDLDKMLLEYRLSDFVKIPDTTIKNSFGFTVALPVQPNTSFVNSVEEHTLSIPDNVQLKRITVKSGGIGFKVFNPIGTKTFFTVSLPCANKNGSVLSKDFVAPAGSMANPGVASGFIDLSGYDVDLTGILGLGFNTIQSKMIVKSDPNGPTVNVSTSDIIFFEATLADLKLDYARGYFGNAALVDQVNTTVSVFNSMTSGTIDIDALSLNLKIENGFKVAGKFKINQLTNTNTSGNSLDFINSVIGNWTTINSASGSGGNITPSVINLPFNGSNSNLEQFVENHGGNINLGYELKLNPWGNTSGGYDEIYDKNPLRLYLQGAIPLNIGMDNLVVMDTFDLKLIQDPNKTNVKSGILILDCVNGFPLTGELELTMLNSFYQPVGTITGNQPVLSGNLGTLVNGIMQKQSQVIFDLPASTLGQLDEVKYCLLRLKLNTPDGTGNNVKVTIPQNAFFDFKLKSKFILEIHL